VFFIPAVLSLGGLLLCVAYFVLFKLPAFILSVLGWLLLISLFSGAGLFCYEKLIEKRPPNARDSQNSQRTRRAESYDYDYDVTATAEDARDEAKKTARSWFGSIRRTR
jgi:UPF0716 family protein affecting phage T7 exclusion